MIPAGSFAIPAEHPALPGHFPGAPLVPGVVLLDRAASLILQAFPGYRLAGLPQVKFLRPVQPGETLHVAHTPTPPRIAFTCHTETGAAVRGTLLLAAPQ